MNDLRPIDHKDSDTEYAALVRIDVAQRAGCELLDYVAPQFLVGRWASSIDYKHDNAYDHEFKVDGTVEMPISYKGDGRFAYWNGDGSLCVFLTRMDG